jgi:DNA primase
VELAMLSYQICAYYGLIPTIESSENCLAFCPFHEDHNPSLSVSDTCFHCWSCHESGNIFEFVMRLEKKDDFDDWDAILKIAEIEQTEIDIDIANIKVKSKLTEEEGLIFAKQFFDSLRIPIWNKLPHHSFIKRGLKADHLVKNYVKINSSALHSTVIPLIQNGDFRGFVCRRENEKIDPKYINNEGLKKEKVVVANLTGRSDIILVEGMVDYLKVLQFGYTNVACILGSYISDQQVAFIRNYATGIIDGFDNDNAGLKATQRLKDVFTNIVPVYKIPLKRFNDVGDMNESQFMGSYASIKRIA